MKNILVIIPARSGSKGVVGKNMKLLGNKPLIGHTIDTALEIFNPENICISSNDINVINYAETVGLKVPFKRPEELSTDSASMSDVLVHAVNFYKFNNFEPEIIVLLQPTSPFRKSIHIQEALKEYNCDLDMVVSVKESKSNPYFVLFEEDANGFLKKSKEGNFIRRQDSPKVWELNGAIYVINVKSLNTKKINEFSKIKRYAMEEMVSHDIDTEFDWMVAEIILSQSKEQA